MSPRCSEERERLADDLHDFVSQELFATAMQIEAIVQVSEPRLRDRLCGHSQPPSFQARSTRRCAGSELLRSAHLGASQRVFGEVSSWRRHRPGFAPNRAGRVGLVSTRLSWAPLPPSDDVVAAVRELLSNVASHVGQELADHGNNVVGQRRGPQQPRERQRPTRPAPLGRIPGDASAMTRLLAEYAC